MTLVTDLLGLEPEDKILEFFLKSYNKRVPEIFFASAEKYYEEEFIVDEIGLSISFACRPRFLAHHRATWNPREVLTNSVTLTQDVPSFDLPIYLRWGCGIIETLRAMEIENMERIVVFDDMISAEHGNFYFSFLFQDNKLSEYYIELKPKPLPSDWDGFLISLDSLDSAIGLTTESLFSGELFKMNSVDFESKRHIITDGDSIDLLQDCGLSVYIDKNDKIAGYKFYNDREQDSVRWAGELPFNLDWDLNFKKINTIGLTTGRDDRYDGYLIGKIGNRDIHVYYNKLHGAIARLTYGKSGFLF